ncbi:hypothetical protein Tco_0774083 [Tanacetum coccineum]|uniref:FAR1 domain-containing protein n=1 Tax=Tanacetum coccineum TaxID=301880 RepID=A0ABQ4ZQL0_9ASTR
MFNGSSSISSLESEEKAHHNLRRISVSEERTRIMMIELVSVDNSLLTPWTLSLNEDPKILVGTSKAKNQRMTKSLLDSIQVSEQSSVLQNSVLFDVVDESFGPSDTALTSLTEEIVAYEHESDETQATKNVSLVRGTLYDSVDDCIVAYMKYVAEAGFVVRKPCQKRLRSGVVKQKCLVCNKKAKQQEVPNRFEDQEQFVVQQVVIVQEEVVVQEKEDLVQDEKELIQEEEGLFQE